MNEFDEKVLSTIINCEVSLYTCCYAPDRAVVSTSNLASLLECTKYKVRKALRVLKDLGYIEYTSQGRPAIESNTENGRELICEPLPPINGYALTKLGYETVQFKEAQERFNKSMEDCVNSIQLEI